MISLLSDDDKENAGVQQAESEDPVQQVGNGSSHQGLPKPVEKHIPSTPDGRLAFPDLIGMDDVKRAVQDISPEDRIEWDAIRSSNSLTGRIRARKRARSSSPVASPPGQLAAFINSRAQLDPGSELWGRYSWSGSNVPTPEGHSVPALAHIMHTSSPQSGKERATPRSVGGFQRANSCGNQFPKRRRVGVGGSENDDVFSESVRIGPSKLSVLIERVQEGLDQRRDAKQTTQISAPSSVKPFQRRRHEDFKNDSSIQHAGESETMAPSRLPPSPSKPKKGSSKHHSPIRSNDSDYGDSNDEDFDASLLDVLVPKHMDLLSSSIEESNSLRRPLDSCSQSPKSSTDKHLLPHAAAEESTSSDSRTLKDEFYDSDEDVFAADLEDIAAKFDKQTSTRGKASPTLESAGGIPQRDSDDEFFDGGLDEEDFEAAEAAATQLIQQTAQISLPVCSEFP